MKKFSVHSNVIQGENATKDIGEIIKNIGCKKLLLVCDKGVREAGIVDKVLEVIETAVEKVFIFDGVMPNPTDILIDDCARTYAKEGIQCIVATGGGSVIDAAKAINIILTNGGQIRDYEVPNSVSKKTLPLIAVPTTSGTASEVTSVSVITNTNRKKKMVILGENVGADYAILDHSLTYNLPARITAATGMDALTHAIEAYVSTLATPFTDVNALGAIELILDNLETAVMNGNDKRAREMMMIASTMAGFAFDSAILGLVHAIAHPLGAHFNVAHGVANAIMLPYVLEYNGDHCESKIRDIGNLMGINSGVCTPDKVAKEIYDLNNRLDIPRLSDLNIGVSDFDTIAKAALEEPSIAMNPKPVTYETIVKLLEKAY